MDPQRKCNGRILIPAASVTANTPEWTASSTLSTVLCGYGADPARGPPLGKPDTRCLEAWNPKDPR